MDKFYSRIFILILFLLFTNLCFSQATVQFRISTVYSDVNDMDGFANSSDPQWVYQMNDSSGNSSTEDTIFTGVDCVGTRTVNDVFFSEIYNCNLPTNFTFRWRGIEDDSNLPNNINNTNGDAVTSIQNININSAVLNLGQSTWGAYGTYTNTASGDRCPTGSTVTWRVSLQYRIIFSSFPSNGNDTICNAVNLGTLNSGGTLGNNALSNYTNLCAGNTGDPNPWGGDNDQGVWFQFTTGTNPSSTITIDAKNDPQNIGNDIDLQIALYESSNNTCTGALTLINESYEGLGSVYDEEMAMNCLKPNTTYFILIDGEYTFIIGATAQEGYFGLQINDSGITQAVDLICDAEVLGQVPDGGSISTPALSRSNICATNTGDPIPNAFGTDKGVWFQFQAPTSGRILIEANSDTFVSGNSIDIQLAVYATSSGTGNCSDTLVHLNSIYTSSALNEYLPLSCLNSGDFYWVLVDGSSLNTDGVFDITISDTNTYDTNTWNGTFWSRSTPNEHQLLVIDANYNTTTNGNINACNLIVNGGNTLTVSSGDYVNCFNNLTINGTLDILNNGSLIQENDLGINTGNISYERNVDLRLLDYVYWSSPVSNYLVNNISPATPNNYIFKWTPNTTNNNGGVGIWEPASGDIMNSGKGYIVRGPDGYSNTVAQSLSTTFSGVPNNGIITIPISRGNYTGLDYIGTNNTTITRFDDNWNLIGNPYPSSINALEFISLNTNIEGAIRLWTHSSIPSTVISDPFYGDFSSNYSPTDYITFNSLGAVTGPLGFNGYIAGGQGFFINMLDGTAAIENVTFNNSLRGKTYDNTEFYKQNSTTSKLTTISKSRIWLDIVNSNHISDRVLIGYINGATNEKDRLFDAIKPVGNGLKIYSIIEQDKMTIQGRPMPFNEEDRVAIGVNILYNEPYQIAIAATDGIFISDQNIYLEDNELGIIHDLKQSPYTFSSEIGEYNNRFVLRYTNEVLSVKDYTEGENIIVVSNDIIQVLSSNTKIKEIEVYSILGQLIFNDKNINAKTYTISSLQKTNNTLILKIITKNNIPIYKKIIY